MTLCAGCGEELIVPDDGLSYLCIECSIDDEYKSSYDIRVRRKGESMSVIKQSLYEVELCLYKTAKDRENGEMFARTVFVLEASNTIDAETQAVKSLNKNMCWITKHVINTSII